MPRVPSARAGLRPSSPVRSASFRPPRAAAPTAGWPSRAWASRGWPWRASAAETGIAHPWHAAAAILGFAIIYLGVGTVVGALVPFPLEGSLLVAFIFILDVFSGPGMTEGEGSAVSISRSAADVLISAAVGQGSPTADWIELGAWAAGALILAFAVFVASARSRL